MQNSFHAREDPDGGFLIGGLLVRRVSRNLKEKLLHVEQTGGAAFADACRGAFDSAQKVVDAQPEERCSLRDLSQMAAGQELLLYSSKLESIPDFATIWV